MGVSYIRPPRAAGSGSRGTSGSQTEQPSTSGAAEQEAESHRRPIGAAGLEALTDEIVFRITNEFQASFHEQFARSFRKVHHRIRKVQKDLARVERKVDLLLANRDPQPIQDPQDHDPHDPQDPQDPSNPPNPDPQDPSNPDPHDPHEPHDPHDPQNPQNPSHQDPQHSPDHSQTQSHHSSPSSSHSTDSQHSPSPPHSFTPIPSASPPATFGPELPPYDYSQAMVVFDDAKRGRNISVPSPTDLLEYQEGITLRQPSLWIDADVAAAIRLAMEFEQARLAENYIRDEAVRFMRQQAEAASSSSQSDMQIVLAEPPRSESPSRMPTEFASTDEYLEYLRRKYELKLVSRPRVVTPISIEQPSPISMVRPSSTSASDPTPTTRTSDPSPGSTSIRGRFKRTARKRVPPPPRASVFNIGEDEPAPQDQAGTSSRTPTIFERAQEAADAIPAEVEVKVEIDEMTQEEFDYFGTTNLTFSQAQMLDAMRSRARVGKGKVELSNDPDYSPWAFKVRDVHLPSGATPIDLPSSRKDRLVGINEEEDLRRAIQESLELERQEKERAEREHLEDLARIKEAEEAELKELWDKCEEGSEQIRRERERHHKL